MTIEAILFDADGVLQRPAVPWRQAFERLLGFDAMSLDTFMRDLRAAEFPALCAPAGFEDELAAVLDRWNCAERLTDTLRVLTAIEVYDDVMEAVQALRYCGVACHLASNQQSHRARHMSEGMGYRSLFDGEFYSCYLGVAKPDVEYFAAILRGLGLPGRSVLFLDDVEANVAAAREVGLSAVVYDGASGVSELRRLLIEFGLDVRGCDARTPRPAPSVSNACRRGQGARR
ncbi:MAG: HAD-IA family hydrolase [Deltaproteobacteria bacterium]|nr:HAD-IA family hydrolase [Deltaproteobacteria bacterium]